MTLMSRMAVAPFVSTEKMFGKSKKTTKAIAKSIENAKTRFLKVARGTTEVLIRKSEGVEAANL